MRMGYQLLLLALCYGSTRVSGERRGTVLFIGIPYRSGGVSGMIRELSAEQDCIINTPKICQPLMLLVLRSDR